MHDRDSKIAAAGKAPYWLYPKSNHIIAIHVNVKNKTKTFFELVNIAIVWLCVQSP